MRSIIPVNVFTHNYCGIIFICCDYKIHDCTCIVLNSLKANFFIYIHSRLLVNRRCSKGVIISLYSLFSRLDFYCLYHIDMYTTLLAETSAVEWWIIFRRCFTKVSSNIFKKNIATNFWVLLFPTIMQTCPEFDESGYAGRYILDF